MPGEPISRLLEFAVCLCFVAVLLLIGAPSVMGGPAPNPTYGTASVSVNGTIEANEWNLTQDFFAYMYPGFDATKTPEASAYLRYNCSTQVMYVLVLTLSGFEAQVDTTATGINAWGAINGAANKVYDSTDALNSAPPQFAWVPPGATSTAQGYEASFSYPPGAYYIIVHVDVVPTGGGSAQTAGFDRKTNSNGIPLVISCAGTVPANPTISTSLSSSSITVGGSVYDTATLTGATSTAGGTVTYTVYTDSACTLNPQAAGTVTVTNGTVPNSNPITFNSAGTFYWQAMYSGDSNNNGATSSCTSEQLTVNPATGKASPTISTTPSAGGAVGTVLNDTATVTGGSSATGTVSFALYDVTDSSCTGTPVYTQNNVALSGGSASTSPGFTSNKVGTYHWIATYNGDSNNNSVSSSCASEPVTTTKASPTATTQASPTTNIVVGTATTVGDTATISNGYNLVGQSVTFTLYSDNTCGTPVSGVSGSGAISGTTASYSTSWTPSAPGTYYWQASYAGDLNNNGFTTLCGAANEQLTVNPAGTAPSIYDPKTVSLFNDKDGDGKVNAGDILLYTVTISNNGTATATGVTYNDTVDPHTSLICSGPDAPSTSQGSISHCNPGPGGSLTVAIGDIAAGASVTITYKVEVESGNFNTISNQGETTGTNFTPVLTDNPNTPAPHDPTVISVSPPPTVGGDPPIWGDIVVFPTPEWSLGRDLNGDGDPNDIILRYKNLVTGEVVNTGIPVAHLNSTVDIYEDMIVFQLRDNALQNFTGTFNLGGVLNGGPIGTYNLRTGKVQMIGAWGYRPTIYKNIISISGDTVRYYDLNTDRLIDTGIPGQDQALWGRRIAYRSQEGLSGPPLIHIYDIDTGAVINTGVPGYSPAIYGNIVVFVDSDGVIRYYDMSTQTLFNTGEEGSNPAIYDRRIVFTSGNLLTGDVRYFDLEGGRAYDTGQLGAEPCIYEDTITYYDFESLKGVNLGGAGDQDQLRPIVKTHQITASDRMLPKKAALPQTITVPSSSAKLSITRILSTQQAHTVRFMVEGVDVQSIEVEVYNLGGRRVFDSGFAPGRSLTWNLLAQDGRLIANGVYLYVVQVRGADGKVVRSQIQKLVVLR